MEDKPKPDGIIVIKPEDILSAKDPKTGKFVKGHKPTSVGNPHGQTVEKLRQKLLTEAKKPANWSRIINTLIEKAVDGDAKHMALLLGYVIGKPVQQMDVNMTATALTPEQAQERVRQFFSLDK